MARDWRAGARRVLAAVEERFAKPTLGVFLERRTLQDILVGPADQLARELNARRVLLDPAPAWLLGLLGGAAVAAVAGRAATALAQLTWAKQEAAYGTESARIAQLQYKSGVKTIYDVLQAQQAAQSALNDDVAARVNYVDAVVKLRVSLGTFSAQSAVADL